MFLSFFFEEKAHPLACICFRGHSLTTLTRRGGQVVLEMSTVYRPYNSKGVCQQVNNGQNLVNVVYEWPLKVNKKNQKGAIWFCLGSSFFFDIRIAQSVNTCEVLNWIILFLSSSKKGQVNCASNISTDNLQSLFLENVINEIRL